MRTIEVSTEVFAKIWTLRGPGEETEDAILFRVLGIEKSKKLRIVGKSNSPAAEFRERVLWREDVKQALADLGGEAHLSQIYQQVRSIRRSAGRSLPNELDAIVRRELENNSSDAGTYTGHRDWFRSVNGLGAGVWALRIAMAR